MTSKVNWEKYLKTHKKFLSKEVKNLSVSGTSPTVDDVAGAPSEFSAGGSEDADYNASDAEELSRFQKLIREGFSESGSSQVEVQRQDPNSPFYSVKTFEALHLKPNLLKGVYEMGFNVPSKIQETALPTLLADPPKNLIAQSQSGTGKTAAFVLAMLSRVDATKHYPQVLCLSPTYELTIQTGEVAAHIAKFCPEIELRYAVRGEEFPRGKKITEHIIVGTPGKVLDCVLKYHSFDIKKISVFVLDEAEVMLTTPAHLDPCIRIHKNLSPNCQMMYFSDTYSDVVMEFATVIVPNALIIKLKREEERLDNIQQYYVKCVNKEKKYDAITNIYGTVGVGQTIIFCQTKRAASWLSEKMTKDGHAVALLTGDLTVEQRINVLDRFRTGKEKVLITTNVFPRGINVEQITIVFNYDLPVDQARKPDWETYLHRIGRTGRFGKRGIAINLVDTSQSANVCQAVERHFGQKIKYLNAEDVLRAYRNFSNMADTDDCPSKLSRIRCFMCGTKVVKLAKCDLCGGDFHPKCLRRHLQSCPLGASQETSEPDLDSTSQSHEAASSMKLLLQENTSLKRLLALMDSRNSILMENNNLLKEKITLLESNLIGNQNKQIQNHRIL